jgi:hypothetical protein
MVCMMRQRTVIDSRSNSCSSPPSQSPMVASLRQLSCYQASAGASFARNARNSLLGTNNPGGQNHIPNSQILVTQLCSYHDTATPRNPTCLQATRARDTPPRFQKQQRTSSKTAAYDELSKRSPERQLEVFGVDTSADPNMYAYMAARRRA